MLSKSFFVAVERWDIQIGAGDEPEDHVLVLQEPAGDPAGVAGGGGAPVDVRGQASLGDDPAVQMGNFASWTPGSAKNGRVRPRSTRWPAVAASPNC